MLNVLYVRVSVPVLYELMWCVCMYVCAELVVRIVCDACIVRIACVICVVHILYVQYVQHIWYVKDFLYGVYIRYIRSVRYLGGEGRPPRATAAAVGPGWGRPGGGGCPPSPQKISSIHD